MFRAAVVLILILLSTLACSLDWSGDDPVPLPSATPYSLAVVPVTNVLPTQTTAPTRTPAPTATGMSSSGSSGAAPVVSCTPRTDWPIYTVVGGDTLASIARRTGTTTDQLTKANCLSNPNLIAAGQGLRVPYLPGPVPTWTPAGIQRRGYVQINPYITFINGIYLLQVSSNVTVSWPEGPGTGALAVEFVFVPDGAAYGIQIGLDTNMADGAAVIWSVPAPITGRVYASGRLPGQTQPFVESNSVAVLTGYSDVPTPQGKVVIQPYLSLEGDNYTVADDTTLILSWPEASKYPLTQVEFVLYFPGTNQAQSLGIDNNLADGAVINWRIPKGVAGQIVASGRFPGQTHNGVASNPVGVQASQPIPPPSVIVKVDPVVSFDGKTYVVAAGSTVALSWTEAPFNQIGKVDFILDPAAGTGPSILLGTDTDFSDGNANITWTVAAGASGILRATTTMYENGAVVRTDPVYLQSQ